MKPTLTEEYRQVLKDTHAYAGHKQWGNTGNSDYFDRILQLIDRHKKKEILDYGAGWGGVKAKMAETRPDIIVHEFEPARDDVCAPAEPCEFVVCTDVFEHVEPDCLDAFFLDLQRVVQDVAFFTVSMVPAQRILTDGRNAHLIQKPFGWWLAKVSEYFDIRFARHVSSRSSGAIIVVEKKAPIPDYHKD